jgi:putative chitinase
MDISKLLTKQKLIKILPSNNYIDNWYEALIKILPDYDITTPRRIAAFLAQCSHESAEFTQLKENLNYSAKGLMKTWPSRFTNITVANNYARNPRAIANKVYSNRLGNGPESSDDGWKYRGRGIIQLTGYSNYKEFADDIDISVDDCIPYLESFEGAVHAACWFWDTRSLNKYSDNNNIKEQTRIINGGYTNLTDRINKYNKYLSIINSR